ncbi:hypothetical protein PR048_014105 [Dryococelus australis]|uniref:Uncharacterized protein n=1 Tax=Dryococelus australis TaxID=614101 RepID=A0ABQ9HDB4_9NEOP|nr:hypothetical protein PR048_014105 [Dryococelus australis]
MLARFWTGVDCHRPKGNTQKRIIMGECPSSLTLARSLHLGTVRGECVSSLTKMMSLHLGTLRGEYPSFLTLMRSLHLGTRQGRVSQLLDTHEVPSLGDSQSESLRSLTCTKSLQLGTVMGECLSSMTLARSLHLWTARGECHSSLTLTRYLHLGSLHLSNTSVNDVVERISCTSENILYSDIVIHNATLAELPEDKEVINIIWHDSIKMALDSGRGGIVVSLIASHRGEPGSTPDGISPGFPHVGILPDDAIGRRVFSGISSFTRHCISALLHAHLTSSSSALKTSILRAAQISPTQCL